MISQLSFQLKKQPAERSLQRFFTTSKEPAIRPTAEAGCSFPPEFPLSAIADHFLQRLALGMEM